MLAGGVGRLGAEVRRPAEGPVGLVHDVPHLLDAVGQPGQVLHRVAQRAGRHVAQLGVHLAHRLLQAGDRLVQPREGGGRGGLPGGDRLLLGPGAVDGDGEASPLVAGLLGVRELGGQGVDLGGRVRGRTALGGGRAVRPAVLGVGERPGREVDALGQPGDLGVGGVLVGLGDRVDGGQGGCGVLRAAAHLARVALDEAAGQLGGHPGQPPGEQLLAVLAGGQGVVAGLPVRVRQREHLGVGGDESAGARPAAAGGFQGEAQRLVAGGPGGGLLQASDQVDELGGELLGASGGLGELGLGLPQPRAGGHQVPTGEGTGRLAGEQGLQPGGPGPGVPHQADEPVRRAQGRLVAVDRALG